VTIEQVQNETHISIEVYSENLEKLYLEQLFIDMTTADMNNFTHLGVCKYLMN
jgi:hypothetical protein